MSGSQSYLLSLYGSVGASSAGTSLLDTLYGHGGSTLVGGGTANPVQALATAQRTEATGIANTEKQPDVQTAIANFTKAVNKAPDLATALANPAVMNVLLTAAGLSDQIGNTALATKVLTSNLSDPNSLANVLTDTRWKAFAQTYNLQVKGLAALQDPKTLAAITQGYAQMTWLNAQDASTPGISDALTFIQQASTITSVDQILGNTTVRNVVTTALGIPEQIAFQSINAQENAISTRLNVADFQKPGYIQAFAERFLIETNMTASSSGTSTGLTSLAAQVESI